MLKIVFEDGTLRKLQSCRMVLEETIIKLMVQGPLKLTAESKIGIDRETAPSVDIVLA